MPCPYWRRFLMPLVKPRFSLPWIEVWLPSIAIEGG